MSSAPRILGIIAAAAVTGGLAACGAPGQSAHPAAVRPPSAAAVQVRVQPDVTGWSGMVQRPHVIYVGMGGAPIARRLAWRHWGSRKAWASGKLDIYWPQPGPISGWHPATYPVTVRLQDIQTHNGQPYYRKMAYIYLNRRGIAESLQFRFSVQPGGSAPSWNPNRPGMASEEAVGTGPRLRRPDEPEPRGGRGDRLGVNPARVWAVLPGKVTVAVSAAAGSAGRASSSPVRVIACVGMSFQPDERGSAGAEEGLPCPISQGLLPTTTPVTFRAV